MFEDYSKILLRWTPAFVELPNGEGMVNDHAVGIFMIEQLIAAGAQQVVSDADVFLSPAGRERLSPILQKRLTIIDSRRSRDLTIAVLDPLLREFDCEANGYSVRFSRRQAQDRPLGVRYSPTSEQLALLREGNYTETEALDVVEDAIATLCFSLPDFLLACENQLQLEFSITDVQTSLSILLLRAREPNTRAGLATLAGLFQSYRPVTIQSPELRSVLGPDSYDHFVEFVESEYYRKMSNAGWRIGIPSRLRHAVADFSRYSRRLANSRGFKPLVNLTSKVVSAATHLPVPDSEVASLVSKAGYIPPIVQLDELRREATAAHRRLKLPVLHPFAPDISRTKLPKPALEP